MEIWEVGVKIEKHSKTELEKKEKCIRETERVWKREEAFTRRQRHGDFEAEIM